MIMNRPKEWKEGTLDDLCELKQDTCLPVESGSDFYVGLEHVESGRFSIRSNGKPEQVMSAKSRFEVNNVLYGKLRPYLDKAVVADKSGICSTDILVLSPKVGTPSFYVAGLLHSDLFIQHAIQTTHGVNHPRTSWKAIKDFRTIIPPLPEQRKIAAVLFRIQKAIELQEAIIERTRELKKAAMQFVFTHGLRGEKTKETGIGRMPESWEVIRLGSVCNVIGGYAFRSRDFVKEGILIVKIGNLQNDTIKITNDASYISNDLAKKTDEKFHLNPDDVLIALTGATTGKLAQVPKHYIGALLNQRVGKFVVSNTDRFDIIYGKYYFQLQSFQNSITNNISQSAQGNISPSKIENILIPSPLLPEQQEIAYVFQSLDRKVNIIRAKKSALQDLFKTTLNKLMSGEIRVMDLEIEIREVTNEN